MRKPEPDALTTTPARERAHEHVFTWSPAGSPSPSASRMRRITANRRLLRTTERAAVLAVRAGQLERAVSMIGLGARFASQRHPGQFCSVPFEENLDAVSHLWFGAAPSGPAGLDSPRWPARVLHVCTRTVALGGHTRWLERLIAADSSRQHAVVVTSPDGAPPISLQRTVAGSGGRISFLPTAAQSWRDRAAAVRDLAAEFDAVIVTTDPGDPLPSLAFGSRLPGQPVIRFNHADHIFWLGAGSSDVLIEFRPIGASLSVERRGYPGARQVLIPLPIDAVHIEPRDAARQALGLPGDATVALSVGASYKFGSPLTAPRDDGEPSFSALVDAALSEDRNLIIIAIGPDLADGWSAVVDRWDGRFVVVPPTRQLTRFMSAADIFVNPFPVGSDTVMWEAAAAALPIVMMLTEPRELALIRGDPAELGSAARTADGVQGMAGVLGELAASPAESARLGSLARRAAEPRLSPQWADSLDLLWPAVKEFRGHAMRPSDLAPVIKTSLVDSVVASWSTRGALWGHVARRVWSRNRLAEYGSPT